MKAKNKKEEKAEALLLWSSRHKRLLKIQKGTGDNLTDEDVEAGYVDYVLYSVFKFGDIGLDGELELELESDGQMMTTAEVTNLKDEVPAVYGMAFDAAEWNNDDLILLKKDFGGRADDDDDEEGVRL